MDKTHEKEAMHNIIKNSMGYIEYMNKVLKINNPLIRNMIKKYFSFEAVAIKKLTSIGGKPIEEEKFRCSYTHQEIADSYKDKICSIICVDSEGDSIKLYRIVGDSEGIISHYKGDYLAKGLYPLREGANIYFETLTDNDLDKLKKSLEKRIGLINGYKKLLDDIYVKSLDNIEKLSKRKCELGKYLEVKELSHLSKDIDQQLLKSLFKIKNLNRGLSLVSEVARMDKYLKDIFNSVIVAIVFLAILINQDMVDYFTVNLIAKISLAVALLFLTYLSVNYTVLILHKNNYLSQDPDNGKLWDAFESMAL